jgi:hypothetical protein
MKTFIVALVSVLAGAVDAQVVNQCVICPNSAVNDFGGDAYAPHPDDPLTYEEMIEAVKLYKTGSDDCGHAAIYAFLCCPGTAPVNPCIICPNGATEDDDVAPYPDSGHPQTCADYIEQAKHYKTGSDACRVYDSTVPYCCPPVTASNDHL